MDERNQRLSVMLNAEVLQIEVAIRFVVGVSLIRKVVRADRHAAVGKASAGCGIEEFVQHAFPVRHAQCVELHPARLVKACAKAFYDLRCLDRLCYLFRIDIQVEQVPTERR